jgi:hypothetical protein
LKGAGLIGCLAGVLAAPAAFGQPAPAAQAVIDRYIAWRGGAAFRALESVEQTGRIEVGGLTGTYKGRTDRNGDSRQDMDLGVVKITQAENQTGGWMIGVAGQVENQPAAEAEDARREALLDYAGILTLDPASRITLAADEIDEGRRWKVVRLTFGDKDAYDLFIDGESGELHGARIRSDRQVRFLHMDDWRLVDKVREPFAVRVVSAAAAENVTLKLLAYTLNSSPQPGWLERPVGGHVVDFGRTDRTNWIPFEFFDDNRLFIPIMVNGVGTVALLDSGASSTVIDQAFAKTVGVAPEGAIGARGVGGSQEAAIGSATLSVGSATLKGLKVAVLPLAGMEPQLGHRLPVILGKEILGETVADIDFVNKRIAFVRADAYRPPAGSLELPLQVAAGGLRSVAVSVEGGPPIQAQFDLGAGSPLLLFSAFAQSHDFGSRPRSARLSGGVGGVTREEVLTISRLTVAGVDFHDVPTSLGNPGASAIDSERVLANVGMPVWRRFHLAIDFQHDRLFVTPEPNAVNAPFRKDRTGLDLTESDKGLAVEFVSPGSPAEKAAWKVGDRILTVDGQAPSAGALWRYGTTGSSVRLTGVMSNGKTFDRSIVLRDYF